MPPSLPCLQVYTQQDLIEAFQLISSRTAYLEALAASRFNSGTKPVLLVMQNLTLSRCVSWPSRCMGFKLPLCNTSPGTSGLKLNCICGDDANARRSAWPSPPINVNLRYVLMGNPFSQQNVTVNFTDSSDYLNVGPSGFMELKVGL